MTQSASELEDESTANARSPPLEPQEIIVLRSSIQAASTTHSSWPVSTSIQCNGPSPLPKSAQSDQGKPIEYSAGRGSKRRIELCPCARQTPVDIRQFPSPRAECRPRRKGNAAGPNAMRETAHPSPPVSRHDRSGLKTPYISCVATGNWSARTSWLLIVVIFPRRDEESSRNCASRPICLTGSVPATAWSSLESASTNTK